MIDQRRIQRLALRGLGRTTIVAASLALAVVPALHADATSPVRASDPNAQAAAVAARLGAADRVSQLVVTSVPGGSVLRTIDAAALRKAHFGGVILFADNYRTRPALLRFTRAMQVATLAGDAWRPRAVMAIDQEGGVVRRIADAPPFRSAPQLGAAGHVASTRAQGRATAQVLAALGVQVDLAPVADLDLGPRHVMAARSFGSDPVRVGAHVAAFVDGIQAGGGTAAVKHYPGFGGASVNSDDALATITRSSAQLQRDLMPFQQAVGAGVDMVMVSHARYTAVDRLRPASASPAWYRSLRDDLGFEGVAITDSLHAAGFAAATRLDVAHGCVRAIQAGADIALLTGSLEDAYACRAQLILAARSGALPATRIDDALRRVLLLKARLGLLPPAP
ncbi:MAG: glycoside hydrolase, family 3-like protein [Thermoleophilia bacterium]|nr:glycoside hydrolase, family 3-like protein [Thermoleophilia bacterium]